MVGWLVGVLVTLTPGLAWPAPQDLPAALAARFTEGVAALSAGRLDAAEAAFRAVLEAGGDRPYVHHNLAIVLQRRDRHADALAEFRIVTRLDPQFGPARLLAGTSLLALGQPAAAAEQLEAACRLMPREPAAHLQRADACERVGDAICLADEYRELVALAPTNAEYRYRLGRAYLRVSQWAHERMQAIDPASPRVRQAIGREHLEQGRRDLAERAFLDALAADPRLTDVHLALARLYLEDRRWDEAAAAAARARALAPHSAEAAALQAAAAARTRP